MMKVRFSIFLFIICVCLPSYSASLRTLQYDPNNSNVIVSNLNQTFNAVQAVTSSSGSLTLTNGQYRVVWSPGPVTNLTMTFGSTNTVYWNMTGAAGKSAGLFISGGGGTNHHDMLLTIDNGAGVITNMTFFTNGINAGTPFLLSSGKSVFQITHDGYQTYISSEQSASTGGGAIVLSNAPSITGALLTTPKVDGFLVQTYLQTNFAHATTLSIPAVAIGVKATVTNDVSAPATYTFTTPTVGTSGRMLFRDNGTTRTIGVQAWPAPIRLMSTNNTSNTTNILSVVSKWMMLNYDVSRGTNGTTNFYMWVTAEP